MAEPLPPIRSADGSKPFEPSKSEMAMLKTHEQDGFTLIDMIVTMTVLSIMAAAAIPEMIDVAQQMKLGRAQREVHSEMNSARLIAVTANRPMRIRFNCPAVGQYRVVELIGTPSSPTTDDSAGDRCSDTKWKYPANDQDPVTRPNHDGPVRTLPSGVTFSASTTLEFWPDGTVHKQAAAENPWSVLTPTTGATIKVQRNGLEKMISVNGVGKIQLVQ
jgi:prepilin-type N-terminal cleavage/methylation domain-containing protein